jgi:hypothetical protein
VHTLSVTIFALLLVAATRCPAMVLVTLTWWWAGWHFLVSGG